jgi:hypothetical protein
MENEDLERNPVWQVMRLRSNVDSGRAYIAVSTNHLLTDGGGLFRLLKLLLSSSFDITTTEDIFAMGQTAEIPSLPSSRTVAQTRAEHTASPSVPVAVSKPVDSETTPIQSAWPQIFFSQARTPVSVGPGWAFVAVSPTTITSLKRKSKSHHITGLTSVLTAAFNLAMDLLIERSTPQPHVPWKVFSGTPIDLRDTIGYPRLTTDSFTMVRYAHLASQPPFSSDTSFWARVAEIHTALHDPANRADGTNSISSQDVKALVDRTTSMANNLSAFTEISFGIRTWLISPYPRMQRTCNGRRALRLSLRP